MISFFEQNDNSNIVSIGSGLAIEYNKIKDWARLYRNGQIIKQADFNDHTAKKIFIVETVELGGIQTKLAEVLEISRQSIHNYVETKKYYGLEGLIHGYSPPQQNKSKREQRQANR